MQIDNRDTRVGLVVDEQVTAVGYTLGFGNGRMVGITVGDVLALDTALRQHSLGFVVETVTLPGLRCEHTHIFEYAHGWNTVHNQMSTLATRTEHDEFITTTRRCIGFCRRKNIFLRQAAVFHDLLKCLGGPG